MLYYLPMTDYFNFGALTKEMIMSRLKGAEDAPAVAAGIVKQTILAGVPTAKAAGQNPKESVEQICFGAMRGLLLVEKDLPRGAILILREMAEVSQQVGIDPSELMTWTMDGIARITPMTSAQVREEIRGLIEQDYMGAGEVFISFCEKYRAQTK